MDIYSFRTMFPAFKDEEAYPDEFVELWAEQAEQFLSESWALNGGKFEFALNLMIAHLISLASKAVSGGAGSTGAVQSATEGSVSVSFTAPPTRNGWEFWLSSTPYGVQLWALLNQLGATGTYIGGLPERRAVRKVGGVFL